MRRCAGCEEKHPKHGSACFDPNLVAAEFGCWLLSAPNGSAAWPHAPLPNKTPIVPRSFCVWPAVRPMSPSRTTWVWPSAPSFCGGVVSPSTAWTASKIRPKCPPPRLYDADVQARLLVLACQKPAEVDPTRGGQTHWSIKDLAQYV